MGGLEVACARKGKEHRITLLVLEFEICSLCLGSLFASTPAPKVVQLAECLACWLADWPAHFDGLHRFSSSWRVLIVWGSDHFKFINCSLVWCLLAVWDGQLADIRRGKAVSSHVGISTTQHYQHLSQKEIGPLCFAG